MKRRALLIASGAWAALACVQTRAQSKAPRRIAILAPSTREFSKPQHDAFTARLRELGHVVGRDIVIDTRWADGRYERLPALARELVALNPAVIVAPTPYCATAAKEATSSVPIVFLAVENPDTLGYVASLGRPGDNMTGTSFRGAALATKVRELVREVLPGRRRVAVLVGDDPVTQKALPASRAAFVAAGFEVEYFAVKQPADFAPAFARIAQWRAEIFWPAAGPFFVSHARALSALAAEARLPMVGLRRAFTDAGGLLTYDNDLKEDYRRGANYVDRILKGARPGELAVEQPERFLLIVNLRTAKALGIQIPKSVLIRANEVIQ